MENKNKSESVLSGLFSEDDPLFKMASGIANDVLREHNYKKPASHDESPKTAFGDLIIINQKQISLISKTYENELVNLSRNVDDLTSAVEGANDIIGTLEAAKDTLEATNENLQELLGQYQEKCNKKEDAKKENGAKKPKPKVSK